MSNFYIWLHLDANFEANWLTSFEGKVGECYDIQFWQVELYIEFDIKAEVMVDIVKEVIKQRRRCGQRKLLKINGKNIQKIGKDKNGE